MAAVTALAAPLAAPVAADTLDTEWDGDPNKLRVSCYRGALRTVAWDRPNAVFIMDLLQLGYDNDEAAMLAELVCRNIRGVRNPEYQTQRMRLILQKHPPGGDWVPG